MPKKEGNGGSKNVLFVRLESLEDLARYACRFDSATAEVFYDSGAGRLFAFGERIEDTLVAYYANAEKKAEAIRYAYASQGNAEIAELTDDVDAHPLRSCYINVIGIDMQKFPKAKGIEQKNINCIKVSGVKDLAKAVLKKAIDTEVLGSAYVFAHEGRAVVGAFDLVEELENDKRTFYYAIADNGGAEARKASFIRYDYSSNSIDFTDEFGEHSYMYIKLIHLAGPFPGIRL